MGYQMPAYGDYPSAQAMPGGGASRSIDPIISRLRPRDMMGILDHAFRLYRRHFLTFLAIAAVVYVPVQIVAQGLTVYMQGTLQNSQEELLSSTSSEAAGTMNDFFLVMLILYGLIIAVGLVGGLLQYLSQGALTAAIADSYLERPVSFAGGYRSMFKRAGPLLGAIILQFLIILGIFAPVIGLILLTVFATANNGGGGAAAGVCLAFLLMIPAIAVYAYVYIRFSLVVPAVMVENLGPTQALRRSWRLVEGYWWRTLGLTFILGIISYVVSAGPAALVTGVVALFSRNLDFVMIQVLASTFTILTAMFYIPVQLVATTVYYFDLRVRKEGYDLETAISMAFPLPPGYAPQYASGVGAAARYAPPQSPANAGYTPPPGYGQELGQHGAGDTQPVTPYPSYPAYTPPPAAEPQEPQPTVDLGALSVEPEAEPGTEAEPPGTGEEQSAAAEAETEAEAEEVPPPAPAEEGAPAENGEPESER